MIGAIRHMNVYWSIVVGDWRVVKGFGRDFSTFLSGEDQPYGVGVVPVRLITSPNASYWMPSVAL